ncbi:hypothetical protein EDB84DRAFT_1493672 [Lactarius hengduanensis]|nr:hypothetical protein EDB84DRAFT_1493672 [Lactarius hengduanensis]
MFRSSAPTLILMLSCTVKTLPRWSQHFSDYSPDLYLLKQLATLLITRYHRLSLCSLGTCRRSPWEPRDAFYNSLG